MALNSSKPGLSCIGIFEGKGLNAELNERITSEREI